MLRNDLPKQHWLRIRPIGRPGNRAATSAKIRITDPLTHKLLCYEQVVVYGRQSFHSYYATTPTERPAMRAKPTISSGANSGLTSKNVPSSTRVSTTTCMS